MNIKLSKKQFKFLLKLVHIGNWVVNSNREPEIIDEKYEEVANIIYSYGQEAGLEKYVAYSKHSQAWVGTNYLYMESDAAKMLEEYNDHNFWDQLIDHFAMKDFHKKYGEEKIKEMSSQERFEKFYEFADKYRDEIDDHGIDRFEIIKLIPKEK